MLRRDVTWDFAFPPPSLSASGQEFLMWLEMTVAVDHQSPALLATIATDKKMTAKEHR
jgi:hypothetical protein